MSITAPVYDKSEPKSDKLYPYHLPTSPEWAEVKDFFGSSALFGAGAGMFLKNPAIIWGCMIFAVFSFVNHQPLRQPKDAQSPLMSLGLALMGIFTINIPKLMLAPEVPTQVPVA